MSGLYTLWVALAAKSTALLLLAFALQVPMRRASAAARHLVWTAAFSAVLLLPFGSIAARWFAIDAPSSGALRTALTAITVTPAAAMPWREALAGIWLAGAAIGLIRLWASSAAAARIRSRARAFGSAGSVPVLMSPDIATPAALGVLRPCILVPSAIDDWTAERRRLVLRHEAAHVERRDLWVHFAAGIAKAIYWYNPLIWFAAARLEDERERACDDSVLAGGEDACAYAGHLVDVARSIGGRAAAPGIPMASPSRLESRLRAILNPQLPRSRVTRGVMAAGLFAAMLAAAPLALVRPPSAAPFRLRIGGTRQAANLVTKIAPRYPLEAKRNRIQGQVGLEVVVRKDGTVADIRVLTSPDPSLTDAAIEGVRHWVYRPTLLNGNPVEVVTRVDVNFTLTK